ncbi:MAG: TonB-dependent receptor [Muribaculaceae bacterium]|jgi:hypothetical protein|nr:TonB-dependent receptor [Muribaculaceae bacterium]
MRLKLFLFAMIFAALPLLAQQTGVRGIVVDSESGLPVPGATVLLDKQGISVTTGSSGDFLISNAAPGSDLLTIVCYGYQDWTSDVTFNSGIVNNLETIKIKKESVSTTVGNSELTISENQLEDEEGNDQAVNALTGSSDNIFYQASSYDFSTMYFRLRGYDTHYTETYINGVNFNDPARGRFNYSMLGGMNQAFKNKTIGYGLDATSFALGKIGGANNILTYAKDYAPGFRGGVAYTNSSYYLRGTAMYSTGLNKHGWAVTLSAIGRYSDEGVIPGTFYHSWGYFLAVQKVLNPENSISLVTFGAPTNRASSSPTFQEAYDLADNNLYNPNWGYQNGKKRSARVIESFDPTTILNWVWKPKMGTTLNTGLGFRKSYYSSSALNWYNTADPRPDYYRYLPSFYSDNQSIADFYTSLWENNEQTRQLNWNHMYQVNYLNKMQAQEEGKEIGATYILEKRHSNQLNLQFNSNLETRLSDILTLQAGLNANYTQASYYKTLKDLLGADYWLDIDQFAERDYPNQKDLLQNDIDNPNRHVGEGDRFGYDYNINSVTAGGWVQNMITLPRWDFNYGVSLSYTGFQRDGKMRNGRAPENSLGKGAKHEYFNYSGKVGVTYKIDGRNNVVLHGSYSTYAPLFDQAYVSPRIEDNAIVNLGNEKVFSGDINYIFNYRRFRGTITGYFTRMTDITERSSFYDDQYNTFMNYVLSGVRKEHKGVEIGVAFKLTPSITLSAAGTYSRYQYKNRPTGTRSYENGMKADTTQTVYLKNYYVGGTPQQAYNFGIDWAAPHQWYFNINASFMDDSYVMLTPVRHEAMPNLWKVCSTEDEIQQKIDQITTQEKLKSAFVLNASIGHVIYLDRSSSLNVNLSASNLLNNRNIQMYGYEQGRFDFTNYTITKFPNKYTYAQGIRIYLNLGVKF